jgi:hypothetical protein
LLFQIVAGILLAQQYFQIFLPCLVQLSWFTTLNMASVTFKSLLTFQTHTLPINFHICILSVKDPLDFFPHLHGGGARGEGRK